MLLPFLERAPVNEIEVEKELNQECEIRKPSQSSAAQFKLPSDISAIPGARFFSYLLHCWCPKEEPAPENTPPSIAAILGIHKLVLNPCGFLPALSSGLGQHPSLV